MTSKSDLAAAAVPVDRRNLLNAIHLGVSFCGVFMAFSVSQNFQTSSDHKSAGSTALGILYACFTLANFVSSYIVSTIGSKWSLFIGSLTYVAFVAANIHYSMVVLYIFSGTIGVGASVLWTAQGAYISNCSALHERAHNLPTGSTLGFFNGVFFSIFQVNMIIGSLLAALLFQENVDVGTIFIVMTIIAGIGALSLTCLKDPAKAAPLRGQFSSHSHQSPPPPSSASPSGSGEGLVHPTAALATDSGSQQHLPDSYSGLLFPSGSQVAGHGGSGCRRFLSIFDSLKMLLLPRMIVLCPLMIYSGFSQTYIFGDLPPLVTDRSMKFYVLATIGLFDAIASGVMGKLSDLFGRVIVLTIGFITAGGAILFLSFWTPSQDEIYVFFLVGIVLGISDGVFNTQLYAILGSWFEGEGEKAFANLKLFQAGSTAVAFLVNNQIGFQSKCLMTGAALVIGILCLALFDLDHRSRGGIGSVLDQAPTGVGGNGFDDEGASSPMLHSMNASNYSSPVLHGHSSINKQQRADSLALDAATYMPPPHTTEL